MWEAEKDYLKSLLPQYLEKSGVDIRKPFQCLNPKHPDRHPSMRYDPSRQAVHCFSCGADYDIFDLVGIEFGLKSFLEQKEKVKNIISFPHPGKQRNRRRITQPITYNALPSQDTKILHYLQICHFRANDTEYFLRRGIRVQEIQKFQLGYDPCFSQSTGGQHWKAAILPTGPNSFTARNIDPKADSRNRIRKIGENAFLGWQEMLRTFTETAAETKEFVFFVVEGEFDALSLWSVDQPAVSLGSVSNIHRFVIQLQKSFRDNQNKPTLLLSLDQDEAGNKASSALLEGLIQAGFHAFEADISCGTKDPNEALVANPAAFAEAVTKARQAWKFEREQTKKAYLSNSSIAYLSAFQDGIASHVDTEAIATGFSALDTQLDGGLYEGLYIVGAISSIGKTTLLLQIADQLARKGTDVIIFSLEMARAELIAKSISRHTLELCIQERIGVHIAKTTRGITSGKRYQGYSTKEKEIIQQAIEAYREYADHLFIQEGIGDIGTEEVRSTVRRHIDITGNRPVIIIDYLQILSPYNDRATDKQNTDKAVLELKRISRDYKIPVLGISSFNRINYATSVAMEAFKESGTIEYSSDVLIGLQLTGAGTADFDVNAAKKENPRRVELVVLKNRNGVTGGRIPFRYYPLFNAFVEG